MQVKNLPMTSRYIGTLVSDFHRNMLTGGIYLYPKGELKPQWETSSII